MGVSTVGGTERGGGEGNKETILMSAFTMCPP